MLKLDGEALLVAHPSLGKTAANFELTLLGKVLHFNALICTTVHYSLLLLTKLDCIVLLSSVLHCTTLYYTGLHCTAQLCTALHYTAKRGSKGTMGEVGQGDPVTVKHQILHCTTYFVALLCATVNFTAL